LPGRPARGFESRSSRQPHAEGAQGIGQTLSGPPNSGRVIMPQSDVDVLVQFAPGAKSYARFFSLSELLEAQRGRRVELVTIEVLSPFVGPRILEQPVAPSGLPCSTPGLVDCRAKV
jgi:hypothetical protein